MEILRATSGNDDSAVADNRKGRTTTAEQIKRLILRSGLKSGDSVPTETELCQILGVSRTSVREAIRTLATLDIVEVRHGHGTVVGKMSLAPLVETLVFRGVVSPGAELSDLRDVVELRQAIDLALAERVIEAHRGQRNPLLAALVERMEETAERGKTFLPEDRQFHGELLAPIGNQLAIQLVTAFWDIHTAVGPRLGVTPISDIRRTARAHRRILEAVEASDVAAFRAAIIEHYEPLERALVVASRNSAGNAAPDERQARSAESQR